MSTASCIPIGWPAVSQCSRELVETTAIQILRTVAGKLEHERVLGQNEGIQSVLLQRRVNASRGANIDVLLYCCVVLGAFLEVFRQLKVQIPRRVEVLVRFLEILMSVVEGRDVVNIADTGRNFLQSAKVCCKIELEVGVQNSLHNDEEGHSPGPTLDDLRMPRHFLVSHLLKEHRRGQ